MGTFVVGVHPKGPCAKDGKIQVGDEILKVYKTVCRGRSHLNVSAIIKKAPVDKKIRVVILRGQASAAKAALKKIPAIEFRQPLPDTVRQALLSKTVGCTVCLHDKWPQSKCEVTFDNSF